MAAQRSPTSRAPSWALAAGAAAVIGLGVWWWVAASPEADPGGDAAPADVTSGDGPLLPAAPDALFEAQEQLADGAAIRWDGMIAGRQYALTLACAGDGIVLVGVHRADGLERTSYPCSADSVTHTHFVTADGTERIEVTRPGPVARVAVQISPVR